jgi:hypothetical protein
MSTPDFRLIIKTFGGISRNSLELLSKKFVGKCFEPILFAPFIFPLQILPDSHFNATDDALVFVSFRILLQVCKVQGFDQSIGDKRADLFGQHGIVLLSDLQLVIKHLNHFLLSLLDHIMRLLHLHLSLFEQDLLLQGPLKVFNLGLFQLLQGHMLNGPVKVLLHPGVTAGLLLLLLHLNTSHGGLWLRSVHLEGFSFVGF